MNQPSLLEPPEPEPAVTASVNAERVVRWVDDDGYPRHSPVVDVASSLL